MKTLNLILLGAGAVSAYFLYKKISSSNQEEERKQVSNNLKNLITQQKEVDSNSSKNTFVIRNIQDSRLSRFASDINRKEKLNNQKEESKSYDYSMIDPSSQSYEAEKEHVSRGGTLPNFIDSKCKESWIILKPGESAKFTNDEFLNADDNPEKGSAFVWENKYSDNKIRARKVGYSGGIYSVGYKESNIDYIKEVINENTKCRFDDYAGDDMITGVKRNKI